MVFGLHRFTGFSPSLLRFYQGFRSAGCGGTFSRKKPQPPYPFGSEAKSLFSSARIMRGFCYRGFRSAGRNSASSRKKTHALCRTNSLTAEKNYACRSKRNRGAGGRTRTGDLLITNQLLYQLSHTSASSGIYCIIFSSRCQGVFLFFLLFLRNIAFFSFCYGDEENSFRFFRKNG